MICDDCAKKRCRFRDYGHAGVIIEDCDMKEVDKNNEG